MRTRLLLTFLLFASLTTFAQRDAGGSSNGAGSPDPGVNNPAPCVNQPDPESFKRNNGEGTCGMNGQIRLYFKKKDVPTEAPTLIALMTEDGESVNYISLPIQGDMSNIDKKYISYCLLGGNVKPAKKLIAVFHYANSCSDDIVLEEK